MTASPDRLESAFVDALEHGDVGALSRLLERQPSLATTWITSRSPLHLFADAPGHRPNPIGVVSVLVSAGAEVDAAARDMWHHETPLHWAASNDDVALIDALLDAGADIEHPGSSIDHGPPSESALGYAQWAALRRLWERGAVIGLSHAAALGHMELVVAIVQDEDGSPTIDQISLAFWNASRAGQRPVAEYLLSRGADINWRTPWDGETPLDAATTQQHADIVAWLRASGARPGDAS